MTHSRSRRMCDAVRRSRLQRRRPGADAARRAGNAASAPAPRGFTLVEMLVAVTLVLIMMTMFAQVFQMAGGSISRQRGLAENDQRSRTLTTIIKADLDKRSFRWVYPYAADEDTSLPESYANKRQGYFYISENNPYSKIDDVLQFTVTSTVKDRNKDETPYYGQALNLGSFAYPNQPDADDAQISVNNTGLSTIAEVVYFVRNGNLYRRQLLIREPLATAGSNPQPTDNTFNNPNGKDVFDPDTSAAFHYSSTGPFWNDFDYSAYYEVNLSGNPSAHFLGSDALDNTGTTPGSAIAAPYRRFGFSHFVTGNTNSGRPKEFAGNSAAAAFIGRFTLQECSDTDFRYPQNVTSGSNIPTDPTLSLTLDPNDYSVIGPDDFSGGSRRGEDLLLPNVHAFDVQVWDEAASRTDDNGNAVYGAFVDICNSNGDFSTANQTNSSYGPRLAAAISSPTAINAVFDTWHPHIDIDYDGDGSPDETPPFLPRKRGPAALSAWAADTPYVVGNEVFPTLLNMPPGAPFFYRCIGAVDGSDAGTTTTSGTAGNEPLWPKAAGLTVIDNELVWQAVDNRRPLKAIKLEIRFVDPSTQQMRQLTIVHSLTD